MTTTAADPTAQLPARVLYTKGNIRAGDLRDGDALMVNGEWRAVMVVWTDGDLDAVEHLHRDPNSAERKLVDQYLRGFSEYVVVQVLKETTGDSGVMEFDLVTFRAIDLVAVQVPAQ